MVKVVKFGGSSLASAEQFKKVGNIIRAEESRCSERREQKIRSSFSSRKEIFR